MTFTKTSQKFGQWADSRANTVYGLGFSSEHHLSKVSQLIRLRGNLHLQIIGLKYIIANEKWK